MINFNGNLYDKNTFLISENRGFKYGDAIFETIKIKNNKIIFLEEHYFRLLASMRVLRMEIPKIFTLNFFEKEIIKTINSEKKISRIRFFVYRKGSGFYLPITNEISFVITPEVGNYETKKTYKVDVFRDYKLSSNSILSNLKTNNRILNILASIYTKENNLDNCILLNENKNVAEAINANIFIIKDNVIKTPPLSDGCIKGIIRKKVIEIVEKKMRLSIKEMSITLFEIQTADEFFLTNSIMGIQPITQYRKKKFETKISNLLVKEI